MEPRTGVADSGDLSIDLADLARNLALAAAERDVGVLVLIDEMQDVDLSDLGGLCGANHEAGQRELPFYVAGAGLPSLPGRLSEARSYAERLFTYRELRPLADVAASDAIVVPASQEDVAWDDEAVEVVIRSSRGYPYFIQEFAKAAWNHASDGTITLDDAEYGVRTGLQLLDAGFFQSRWARAPPAERTYLSTMAIDRGSPSSSTEVANRIGKRPTSVGPMRASLIYKGIVFAPEHGLIAFTVPDMAEFIERQADWRIPCDGPVTSRFASGSTEGVDRHSDRNGGSPPRKSDRRIEPPRDIDRHRRASGRGWRAKARLASP